MIILEGNFLLLILVVFPFVAGIASYLIGRASKTGRDFFVLAATAAELCMAIGLCFTGGPSGESDFTLRWFANFGLHFRADSFRMVMAVLTGIIWFATTLQSREYFEGLRNRNRYYLFLLFTYGATMGIFLSANLYTTFIFFEIMSFTSYVMVASGGEDGFYKKAANSYLAFAVLGGLMTLMGLFMLHNILGTLEMDELVNAAAAAPNFAYLLVAGLLVLFGFGVKAGMYPLHTWLPRSYVAAPGPATALLSAILSKAGIFGILVITANVFLHNFTWGMILLVLAVLTMVTGAVLAVFSTNFKRTLACSSMSQIGFILVGIAMQAILGEHNAIAVQGSFLHLLNHSMIKLPLFMVASIIFICMKEFDLNKIRGFGRRKPLLAIITVIPMLGVAGVPLFNGYVSKTLIHESMVEYLAMMPEMNFLAVFFKIVEGLFLFAGGLTLAYMTKIFVAVFVEKNTDPARQAEMDSKKKFASVPVIIALCILVVALPVFGCMPNLLMDPIAAMGDHFANSHGMEHAVNYFSLTNLKGAGVSLAIGVIVYFLFVRGCLMKKNEQGQRVYIDVWPKWLSIEDLIYRPGLLKVLPFAGAFCARIAGSMVDWIIAFFRKILFYKRPDRFVAPLDDNFGTYNGKAKERPIKKGLSFSLLLFGGGVVFALAYLIIATVIVRF